MVLVTDIDKFIEAIHKEIKRRLPKDEQEQLLQFASLLFRTFPLEELRGREMSDVFGVLYSSWGYIQRFDGKRPLINIYNPSLELHGWQSSRTVIQVLARDMPFLVGSIMGELNDREIVIHTIHNTVIHTRRDDKNQLLEVVGRNSAAEGLDSEAVIYLEIARHSDRSVLDALIRCLGGILNEVEVVVGDWQAMAAVAKVATAEVVSYKDQPAHSDKVDETAVFMEWMLANHFTFLGYQELVLEGQGGQEHLVCRRETDLGLISMNYGKLPDTLLEALLKKHFETPDQLLHFGRYSFQSRVHRRSYPELVLVWRYDAEGELLGAHCFMGLYTSVVHTISVRNIPLVKQKVNGVLARAGYAQNSHNGREIIRLLETFPRGELFHVSEDQLFAVALAVFRIRERRQVRLFMAVDSVFGFVSCLVYVPRNLFRTTLRQRLQRIIEDAVNAIDGDFTTFFSESVLARTHFLFRLTPGYDPQVNVSELEQELVNAAKSWQEHLREMLIEELGEERAMGAIHDFIDRFPPGYEDDFAPRIAVNDIRQIRALNEENPFGMSFYRAVEDRPGVLHFRLVREGPSLILSDAIPILEHFGLRVVADTCYEVLDRHAKRYSLQEFTLQYTVAEQFELETVNDKFKQAFYRIWCGESANDDFNKLLLAARLDWREIALLRAYAHYMKQLSFHLSEFFIADTLFQNPRIAASLVRLFGLRFDPDRNLGEEQRQAAEQECREQILHDLDEVESLNQDRVIRHYLTLIAATLRTNYYQLDSAGAGKNYISLKINTVAIDEAPLPRPEYEIFVYSPRVEGVHLRGGKVARGGLRWSDRYEDFRTEVLGLVKAQQVKNAVIVPVGAKGGFVCKRQPGLASREEKQREAVVCYQTFIRGLLDITDNLVGSSVVAPERCVRKDDDDVYLVVAADKGTATFSDIANAVAAEYNFWLGDAFASGGEYGYDHKKMGITARGAWVCVQRHFRELNLDIQQTDFTVIGVGDMSGDVFGNGMLLSEHIQLTAAFNHLHIFIDPDPDAASSYAERQRLFEMPRSGWQDYDASLISDGGGIFRRSAKSIAITPQMRERFEIDAERLTPDQLVRALLKAPTDLLWNGGIGTYVKSSEESHMEVGDKANDAVRIDANELRARVVGEGGNLGITQLARVQYALGGGALNTDFIDNAGGVNCSDHEVNIKILLDDLVRQGDMTTKQRNQLLVSMTGEVAAQVLEESDQQAQALSVAHSRADHGMEEFIRFIQSLVAEGDLDRKLEFIPDDEELRERRNKGQGFTRPELAVLSAYSKAQLKASLSTSTITEDAEIAQSVASAFPRTMTERYGSTLEKHPLQREIVAMRMANDMINHGGITFAHRMRESAGASDDAIVKGYIFATRIYRLDTIFEDIAELDFKVDAHLQHQLLDRTAGLLRGATRWFLRSQRFEKPLAEQIPALSRSVAELWENFSLFLHGSMQAFWEDSYSAYVEGGVDTKLASFVAGGPILIAALNIAEAAQQVSGTTLEVAQLYFLIGEELGLTDFSRKVYEMNVENHWQAIAREGLIDDIASEQKKIAVMVLACERSGSEVGECLDNWLLARQTLADRWFGALAALKSAPGSEFTMYAVVLRELANLSRTESH